MGIDQEDAGGTLAEGSRIFWLKGEPFFEGSNGRAFSYHEIS
jgi:hypothetical protein